jgi:iron complex outermembrane recepter protein
MKHTPTHISTASLLFALGMTTTFAAQAQEAAADATEEIVVTGMRAALDKAIDVKQANDHVMEALSLDDINSTPAVTIAEALVRLPGVNGVRDRGNESQAAIRGLGPRMVFSTLNGREIASSEPGRAVRYEQYPSEMMSAVEVYKTQSADMVEGGIAGTINLKTLSPLEYTGSEAIVRVGLQTNDGGKEIPDYDTLGNRMSASFVHHFSDSFAASFGVSSQKQKNGFESLKGWGYNQGGAGQNAYNPETKQGMTDKGANLDGKGTFGFSPYGLEVEVKEEDSQRTGMVSSLEFKPTDDLDIKYDALYTKVELSEQSPTTVYELPKVWNGENAGAYSNIVLDGNYLTSATFPWANVNHVISEYDQDSTALTQGLSFKYTGIDTLEILGDLSYSKAERTNLWQGITFQQWGQNINFDFREASAGVVVAPGSKAFHPEDSLDAYVGHQSDGGRLTDDLYNVTLDFKKALDAGHLVGVDFGLRTSKREKENFGYNLNYADPTNALSLIPAGYFKSFSVDSFDSAPIMYAPSFKDLANKLYGGDQSDKKVYDLEKYWKVEEDNSAAYVKANFQGELAGKEYDGNIGLRHVEIGTDSSGYADDLNNPKKDANGNIIHQWEAGPTWPAGPVVYNKGIAVASIDYKYDLPSANININLDETKKLRVGIARAISRPPLDELRAGAYLNLRQGATSGSSGNPYLKPYTSDQIDVSYEWYFAKESMAAASLFYKDIDNYIGITTIGTFASPPQPNQTPTSYTITGPINGGGGYVRGLELTFQMPFHFLPIEGFGIYTNYAHAESNIMEFSPTNNPYPMAGLAKNTAVADLWYSAHGFDARLGWKYTSAYTSAFTWDGELLKLDQETSLGFSLSYEFNEHVSARFQVNNLTDQPARLTRYNNDGALMRNDFYGRYMMADVTWKL